MNKRMINKTKILTVVFLLMPWLGTFAGSGLEVVKWSEDNNINNINVGTLPPVDIKTDNGKFTINYGDNIKKAEVEILESGSVVYSDVETTPHNASVTYLLRNAEPNKNYLVQVKADGVVRAVENLQVSE